MDQSKSCTNCLKSGIKLYVCSRCKSVKYCSKDCQSHHYPTHKTECKPPNNTITQQVEDHNVPDIEKTTEDKLKDLPRKTLAAIYLLQTRHHRNDSTISELLDVDIEAVSHFSSYRKEFFENETEFDDFIRKYDNEGVIENKLNNEEKKRQALEILNVKDYPYGLKIYEIQFLTGLTEGYIRGYINEKNIEKEKERKLRQIEYEKQLESNFDIKNESGKNEFKDIEQKIKELKIGEKIYYKKEYSEDGGRDLHFERISPDEARTTLNGLDTTRVIKDYHTYSSFHCYGCLCPKCGKYMIEYDRKDWGQDYFCSQMDTFICRDSECGIKRHNYYKGY